MEYEITSTNIFDKWFSRLKDRSIKRRILARLACIENGNFGDHKSIDTNIFELRFFFGGGLRIYYTIQDCRIVLFLVGGDKSSQSHDIEKSKQLLNQLE